jgi:hypothetical protein
MDTKLKQRAYRKTTNIEGWVYFGGKMREITVKNLSISGALAILTPEVLRFNDDHQQTLKSLSLSKQLDFFLSPLQLSGVAKIVRVAVTKQGQVAFAMAFQDLNHSSDEPCFNRKNYRAEIAIPGQLFLDGYCLDFMTVNMSVDGLMIRLPIAFGFEEGMAVTFKFPHAKLKGKAQVVWTMDNGTETLIGLQHIKPDNQIIVARKPAELPDIHLNQADLPRGDTRPPSMFCGKNWTDRLVVPQKVRQW